MKFVNIMMVIVLSGVTFSAFGSDHQVDLQTPRGSKIKVDIYNPGSMNVLLLAPGQGCNPRLEMYDRIAAEAKIHGFTVVRMYWAYCLTEPTGMVSNDYLFEKEDVVTALDHVRSELKFDDSAIFIGGKSLGSFIGFDVFRETPTLRGLVMLTPVCTDSTDPKRTTNAFSANYPGLDLESRPILFAQGNADPLCETRHFQEYLFGKPANFVPLVVSGDHGFGKVKANGTYDTTLSAKNIETVSKWIFTWL